MLDDHRLWVSQDDGASWSARVLQTPAGLKRATLVSVNRGAFLALAVQTGPADMVTPSSALTLIRSSDGGAHWSQVAVPCPVERTPGRSGQRGVSGGLRGMTYSFETHAGRGAKFLATDKLLGRMPIDRYLARADAIAARDR